MIPKFNVYELHTHKFLVMYRLESKAKLYQALVACERRHGSQRNGVYYQLAK